ncbi:MAG: hypothetical protein WA359_12435 [Acidimicrobiales bacterium]
MSASAANASALNVPALGFVDCGDTFLDGRRTEKSRPGANATEKTVKYVANTEGWITMFGTNAQSSRSTRISPRFVPERAIFLGRHCSIEE